VRDWADHCLDLSSPNLDGTVRVMTIPRDVFFLPNEAPELVADVIVDELAEA
jgi:hypothetical protein